MRTVWRDEGLAESLIKGKGYGLVSTRPSSAGTRLLECDAFLWEVNAEVQRQKSLCSFCLLPFGEGIKCQCGTLYCGAKCKAMGLTRNLHGRICRLKPLLTRKLVSLGLSPWEITTVLLTIKGSEFINALDGCPPNPGPFRACEVPLDWGSSPCRVNAGKTVMDSLWDTIRPLYRKNELSPMERDGSSQRLAVEGLLKRYQSNNFMITDQMSFGIAQGCLPYASLANHSCTPSAVPLFAFHRGTIPRVHFYSLHAVANGEEITISYKDPALSRQEASVHLRSQYGFTCGQGCPLIDSDRDERWASYLHFIEGSPISIQSSSRLVLLASTIVDRGWKTRTVYEKLNEWFDEIRERQPSTEERGLHGARGMLNSLSANPDLDPLYQALEPILAMSLPGGTRLQLEGYLVGALILSILTEALYVHPRAMLEEHSKVSRYVWHPLVLSIGLSVMEYGMDVLLFLKDTSQPTLWTPLSLYLKGLLYEMIQLIERLGGSTGPLELYYNHCHAIKDMNI